MWPYYNVFQENESKVKGNGRRIISVNTSSNKFDNPIMTSISAVFSAKHTMENKLFQSVYVASVQSGTKTPMISSA